MFRTLSTENNITIECNDSNVFKIFFSSVLNPNSNIQNIIMNNQFYELLSSLNQDIIENYHMHKVNGMDDVTYIFNFGSCMKDFFEHSDMVRTKLHLLNKTKIHSHNKFEITGNSSPHQDSTIKECKISNLTLNIEIVNKHINVFLCYLNVDPDFNKLQKNTLAKILSKILYKLKQYLE